MRRVLAALVLVGALTPVAGARDLCGDGPLPTVDDVCEAWVGTYDNPNGYARGGKDIIFDEVATNSRVFVTGRSEDDATGGYDAYTIAYDAASGARVWAARFDSGGSDSGNGIAVSPDRSRVYVTGYHDSARLLTLAYDAATGALLYSTPGATSYSSTVGLRSVVSSDGSRVYTAAFGLNGADARDALLVAQDAGTGEILFIGAYDGLAGLRDDPIGIEVAPDGSRAYLAALSRGTGPSGDDDYAVAAFDAGLPLEDGSLPPTAGDVLWAHRYDGPIAGSDIPTGFDMSPDGSKVFVTGRSAVSTPTALTDHALVTVAVNTADGSRAWTAQLKGPVNGTHTGGGLAVSPDGGRVYITGTITGVASHFDTDVGVAAYAAGTGAQLWSTPYRVPGLIYEQGTDVTAGPTGPFVTGFSGDGVYKSDQITLSFDAATGDQRWAARYNQGVADRNFIRGVAVSPDGRRVVATSYRRPATIVGFSCTNCNEYDYLTLAYDA